jgi:carboxypeptidase-like protein/carboxypeptidase family protein
MKRLQLLTAIACVGFAPLNAQNTTAPASSPRPATGKARILGVVIDSLNARALAGAEILIEGQTASARTDSLGKFGFDGLPPGNFQLGVFHPLLDTLGLSILTRSFHIGPDSTYVVAIAVPPATTIIRQKCSTRSAAPGMSAVIGQVRDPETLQPVARAEVSIAWTDLEISKAVGIRRTPHLLTDSTDTSGEFRFCGLPSSLQATVQARRGSAATAELPVSLGERPVELSARTILLSSADSTAKSGNAAVSGVVLLEGAPGPGSRVELVGTEIIALTNAKGEFTLRNLPSGSRILLARHIGYAAQVHPIGLSSHEQPHVTIKLPKYVAVMDPVLVTARRTAALDKVGFGTRRKSALGYFIGPERLERMHPLYITDVLRMVPGLRVVPGQYGDAVTSTRDSDGGCIQYYVDDIAYTEIEPDDVHKFVSGSEVVAVEVYQSGNAPPQFTRGMGNCTTIVLWTRFKVRS